MAPELQEETQGGGQSIEDRQRENPELKLIVGFQEEGVLPSDDKGKRIIEYGTISHGGSCSILC